MTHTGQLPGGGRAAESRSTVGREHANPWCQEKGSAVKLGWECGTPPPFSGSYKVSSLSTSTGKSVLQTLRDPMTASEHLSGLGPPLH